MSTKYRTQHDHEYACSSVPRQGPAERYVENLKLMEEVGKASRTVEKQERQIEALQSQVGEINEAGRFTNAKVGTILRMRIFFQLRAFC